MDWYVFVWFLIELLCYAACANWSDATLRTILAAIVVLRVVDVSSTTMRIAVFDQLALPSGQPMAVASHVRMIVLGVINYFELILCFAVLCYRGAHLIVTAGREMDWFDPFYLSAISQLTIGYGDLHPTSWLRLVACLQGITSMLLIVLLIGRFVALLPHVVSLDNQHENGGRGHGAGTSNAMRSEGAADKESN